MRRAVVVVAITGAVYRVVDRTGANGGDRATVPSVLRAAGARLRGARKEPVVAEELEFAEEFEAAMTVAPT